MTVLPLPRRHVLIGAGGLAAASLAGLPGAALAQKRGGTMIIALEGEPTALTAHLSTDVSAIIVANNLFSSLIGFDFDFNPTPDLAERWETSADGLTYTFHLTPKARWHDGRPVTSDDVVYSFTEIIAKTHPRAGSWWPLVAGMAADGPHRVSITLKAPYAPFLTLIGNASGSGTLIMSKHVYQGGDPKTHAANRRPIGSGPFKFVRWEPGSFIELARHGDYHQPGKPRLDRLVFQIIPDAAARLIALEKGDVDFLHAYIVPYDAVAKLRADKRFDVIEKGLEGVATNEFLLLNLRQEALKHREVRQALAFAIDREAIREKALFGLGKVARSHVNSGLRWIFTDRFDAYAKRDLARAAALLDQAGFARKPDGKRFALRITWDSGKDAEQRAAQIIRSNLAEVGIDVTLQPFDRATYIDRAHRQWDFDMALQNFTTGPDPTIAVTPRYHTSQIKKLPFVNGMGYSNPALDAVFDAEFTELDRTRRAAMWGRAQEMLMADLPAIPIFEYPVLNVASAKFADTVTNPSGYLQGREDAYLR
jgi:peptide/nickel transport system substrate-binding protein